MSDHRAARRTRAAGLLGLLATIALLVPAFGHSALPDGQSNGPRLVAPLNDVTLSERGVQFAWEAPSNTQRHLLLVSETPFETDAWSRLSDVAGVTVHELERPIASMQELGYGLERDTRLYWAAASVDAGSGRASFSPVRTMFTLRSFSNRVEDAPELITGPIGRATPHQSGGDMRIRLTAGYTLDPSSGDGAVPAGLRAPPAGDGGPRTVLVHYGDMHPDQARTRILASGGLVVSYVPDHTFLVRQPLRPAGALSLESQFAWTGTYHPAYKLSSRFASEPSTGMASVLVFPDGDLSAVQTAALTAGAQVLVASDNGINKIVRLSADLAAVNALALHPDVAWVEPYVQPQLHNDLAQWVVQTGQNGNRRVWDMGLHGEGQVVCTTDSGIEMTHTQFVDPLVPVAGFGDYPTHRKVIAYKLGSANPNVEFGDHAGATFHGTHTAGSVAGNDDSTGATAFDGMAKGAKLYFMDLSGTALLNGVDPFPDLNDLFQPSYDGNAGGAARISSNSWGAAVNGAYTLNSLAIDQFMWNHPDYLIFISNGNSGPGGKVGAPASAKSSVGAGGTQNGTSQTSIYNSTSRGPTVDGRRKPTICSPGQSVISATGGGAYAPLSGTSMASPTQTGATALIRQYLTEGWYPTGAKVPANGFAPSAALLKAMAVNSADNAVSGFTAPDNHIGYGRIKADNVCYFAGDARRLLLVDNTAGLGHLETIEYQVNVVDGAQPLEVTLCWTDAPPDLASAIKLVNNLDLTVTDGTDTYKGNVYSTGFSTTGGSYDDRNVEEAVLVQVPAAGLWTIRIDATNVPVGPQGFGLVITGGVGNGAGTLALDRGAYGASSTVEIQVIDTDAGATVDVTLESTSEPGGETVTLTGGNGLYSGSIPLSPATGTLGDGTLRVSDNDVITATYIDVSPSATLVATAIVSFTPPVITNVMAQSQGNATVSVSWNTNENATSKVYYGLTPALGSETAVDPIALTSHQVVIPGLQLGQTYFYDVESEDLNGNATRDDNGGNHYKFTVDPPAELLLVYGGIEFERADRYEDALTTLGWSVDIWKGSLSENPLLGDLSGGLRAYKAVWWQPGLEHYPAFSDASRPILTQYLDGGGRLAVSGHDIVWGLADPSSPYFTVDRQQWVQNTLQTVFSSDPAGWTGLTGIGADPISGSYTGGIAYAEHRSGASGDEIDFNPAGSGAVYSWRSNSTPDDCGIRWESAGPVGTPGSGVWGGQLSRLAAMYFEWTGIDPFTTPTSALRTEIMRKTLVWLIGRDKPSVAVTSPNGGGAETSSSLSIEWTENTDGGTSVSSRTIDYSLDGGASWTTITSSAGPSPYLWDLTSVSNSNDALVRVRVTDDGNPTLSGQDESDAIFALQRPGGDLVGPVIVAGSMTANPNPIDNQQTAQLDATVTDAANGGGTVFAAEWSAGLAPVPAGSGSPMTGSFGTTAVAVSATIPSFTLPTGQQKLWVRGQDDSGNWGNATSVTVQVNGDPTVSVEPGQVALGLLQNAPNPMRRATEIVFSLPSEQNVELSIFDVSGREIRDLVSGRQPAGIHRVRWDATASSGHRVSPGVYYYRLQTAGQWLQKRLVVVN